MSVANVYAKAFYESLSKVGAQSSAEYSEMAIELEKIKDAIESHKQLKSGLMGPVLLFSEKTKIIQELCKKLSLSVFTERFVLLLCRKERVNQLNPILKEFHKVVVESAGGTVGVVSAASKLDKKDLGEIELIYSKKLGKKVVLFPEEDPTLLAGFKVNISGITYDGSLRSQLSRIKEEFLVQTENSMR